MNPTQNNTPDNGNAIRVDGRVIFYHANGNGNGAAVQFDLKPYQGRKPGCFYMCLAHQKPADNGQRGNAFDWDNKATVKLGFMDVCQFLMVLEGRHQTLAGDNRGLYHSNGGTNTMIALRANETRPGYTLAVSRKAQDGEQVFKGHILLGPAEALGLATVLREGLFHMAFGMPRSEVGGQRPEVGGQRPEVGGQRPEVGGQRSEVGDQRSEVAANVA